MKRHVLHFFPSVSIALIVIAMVAIQPSAFAVSCESLANLKLPDVSITSAKSVPAGEFTPPAGEGRGAPRSLGQLPAHCAIEGVIKPTPVSVINFQVWMPASDWNGKFEGLGNGGLAGTLSYGPMANALRDGFAAASTDTGHTTKESPLWLEDRERLTDYSSRGFHLTTVTAKAIIDAFYGQAAKYSYYLGCSTGGKMGLMEAQRFPADYDGIVAGDAANFWTHQMMNEIWDGVATSTPETNLSLDNLQMIQTAALKACDALDGLADGLINDPSKCHFDPKQLQCKAGETSGCLTAAQVGAVEKMYSGPVNPRTGKKLYAGMYPGNEVGWGKPGGQMVINRDNTSGVSSNEFYAYAMFHNPDWKFRTFDFDRDIQAADEKLGPITNATDPNLEEFRRMGHKLLYYHGTADPLIPAQNGIDYYQSVVTAQKSASRTDEFFKVFLVPGMYHCANGPGATAFGGNSPAPQKDADHDLMSAIQKWVESGAAPQKIIATKYVDNAPAKGIAMQRPLCAYPMSARYNGSGDPNAASSFSCAKP